MQDNLRLILWTIIGVGAAWFLMMAVNRHFFSSSDVNPIVFGSVPMNITDISDRCGDGYLNSTEMVEYKLTQDGKIVYLCPQGIWPLQKRVVAVTLSDAFRSSLSAIQLPVVNSYYPQQPKQAPVNPFVPPQ